MFQALKQKVVKQNRVAGIAVRIAQDGSVAYSFSLLEQEKGKVLIKNQEANITNLDTLKDKIPSDCPIVIQIDGKGFLHKLMESNKVDPNKLVSTIIPNAKDEDFHLQQTQNYISICRKTVLDEWLNNFTEKIALPVAISFGPFSLALILPLMEVKPTLIGNYSLTIENDAITSFSVNEQADENILTIGDQQLNSAFAISYAVALQFLVGSDINCNTISIVTQNSLDWNERLFFKKAGWTVMLFFLVLLMINFGIFSYYDTKNKELQTQRYGSGNQYALQENLQKQVTQKEEFLQKAGWLSPSKMSFYADRLAVSLPSSIKLTELKLHPVEEIIENEIKKQNFKKGAIIITGTCNNPTALNTWIKIVDDYDWIESVKLNNYLYDNREHQAVFKLDIKVKE